MRVYGVMGGLSGDTSIQYVELRMSIGGQVFTTGSQLHFFNASGTETGTYTLSTGPMSNGATAASILIGTSAFDAAWSAGSPDFIMPTGIMAPDGKVAFGPIGGGGCQGAGAYYDSVAYGGSGMGNYTGTVDYPPVFSGDLPTSMNQALQIKPACFDVVMGCGMGFEGNNGDYEIVSSPMPRNNANQQGGVVIDDDLDDDGVLNVNDLCPGTPPATAVDSNGCSNAQVDGDGDGVCNPMAPSGGPAGCTGTDNCPNTANPTQANADSDAFGNACDTEGPSGNTNGVAGGDDCADVVDNDGDTLVDFGDPGCSTTDTDGDGIADIVDNCPSVPNNGQQNYDGDTQGDACDLEDDGDGFADEAEAGTPLCANAVNDDNSGLSDDMFTNDGCPAVGGAEGNCIDMIDNDGDGRINDGCPQVMTYSEGSFNVGTASLGRCGVGAVPAISNAWPLDFVSVGTPNTQDRITLQDLTSFVAMPRKFGTSPGHVDFNMRWDLVPGGAPTWIGLTDFTAMIAAASQTASPPMFGGPPNRAFGSPGPQCTDPP